MYVCVCVFVCVCVCYVSGYVPFLCLFVGVCECYRFCVCCVSVYEWFLVGVGVGRVTNN